MCPPNSVAYHTGVNILAIETATEACSAALLRADGALFSEFQLAPRQHNRLLPQMMDAVLAASGIAKSNLTHCAFSNGPGAFTGIRIGAAQAQGIGIALDIPLLPVSTLAVLAQAGLDHAPGNRVLAALDARMQEIYWANYFRDDDGLARLDGVERLGVSDELDPVRDTDFGVGHGWLETLQKRVSFPLYPDLMPSAEALLRLAQPLARQNRGTHASLIRINYLRNRVADKARAE